MLQESVRKFALERVAPHVARMDESATMDPAVISGLFDAGLMGVEIPTQYGGSGFSFLASCLAVEEMAKVDASVAVCLDVQNTLVNNVFGMWGSDEIRARFWPKLATDTVGSFCLSEAGVRRLCAANAGGKEWRLLRPEWEQELDYQR